MLRSDDLAWCRRGGGGWVHPSEGKFVAAGTLLNGPFETGRVRYGANTTKRGDRLNGPLRHQVWGCTPKLRQTPYACGAPDTLLMVMCRHPAHAWAIDLAVLSTSTMESQLWLSTIRAAIFESPDASIIGDTVGRPYLHHWVSEVV